MVYLVGTENESSCIHTFMNKKGNPKTYLILVIANKGDQILLAKQIRRSNLHEANWLIASFDEFKALMNKYQEVILELIVMELTTTDKGETFFGHNWELLNIEHEPKTDPFDEVMATVVNALLDQLIYNYPKEKVAFQKRANQLLVDFMESGMFKMISDPTQAMGN